MIAGIARRGSTFATVWALLMALGPGLMLGGCEAGPSLRAMRTQGDRALEQRNYAEAVDWYEQYVQRRPIEPEVRYRLGTAYLGLKKPVKAREEFLQGLENDDDVLRRHARNTRQPKDYILFGKFASIVGDPDTAEVAFSEAALLDQGRSVEPQLALADFYGSLGDTGREIERLRMVLFIDVTNEAANARLRELGEVPGPSIVIPPAERP